MLVKRIFRDSISEQEVMGMGMGMRFNDRVNANRI